MPEPRPLAWLNGALVPLRDARISPLDRGFLYADAVYEVVPVYAGRPFLLAEHCARLDRSLRAIGMEPTRSAADWEAVLRALIDGNGGGDLYIYLQVSRGAEWGRNHAIPRDIAPTEFAFAADLPAEAAVDDTSGVAAITCPEWRWGRCDIKSTSLLANVLSKSDAAAAGATEAVFLADGELREGSSSAIVVISGNRVAAPPEGPGILPSTSRALVLALARDAGLQVAIEPVSEAQLRAADEIWMCNATRAVTPVVRLDGAPVGSGRPGPHWRRVRAGLERYRREVATLPALTPGPT